MAARSRCSTRRKYKVKAHKRKRNGKQETICEHSRRKPIRKKTAKKSTAKKSTAKRATSRVTGTVSRASSGVRQVAAAGGTVTRQLGLGI